MSDAEQLFLDIGRLLDGQPTGDVIPALVTLSARSLVEDASGDAAFLEALLSRFFGLLKQQAEDMQKLERTKLQ